MSPTFRPARSQSLPGGAQQLELVALVWPGSGVSDRGVVQVVYKEAEKSPRLPLGTRPFPPPRAAVTSVESKCEHRISLTPQPFPDTSCSREPSVSMGAWLLLLDALECTLQRGPYTTSKFVPRLGEVRSLSVATMYWTDH